MVLYGILIIPLAYFDLNIEQNQFKAFQYNNTTPLYTQENLIKRSIYNGIRY